jgi:hypothetical protein
MKNSVNFGTNVMTQSAKAWSARAERFQTEVCIKVELKTQLGQRIKADKLSIANLEKLKGGLHEDQIPAMRSAFEDQLKADEQTLKDALAEHVWAWTEGEEKWARQIAARAEDSLGLTRAFYRNEYGVEASNEWCEAVLNSLGLDTLDHNTTRSIVRTGAIERTKTDGKTGWKLVAERMMLWNVRQCRLNGLKKYMFAEDVVEVYRTKKEREARANALPSAIPALDAQQTRA